MSSDYNNWSLSELLFPAMYPCCYNGPSHKNQAIPQRALFSAFDSKVLVTIIPRGSESFHPSTSAFGFLHTNSAICMSSSASESCSTGLAKTCVSFAVLAKALKGATEGPSTKWLGGNVLLECLVESNALLLLPDDPWRPRLLADSVL